MSENENNLEPKTSAENVAGGSDFAAANGTDSNSTGDSSTNGAVNNSANGVGNGAANNSAGNGIVDDTRNGGNVTKPSAVSGSKDAKKRKIPRAAGSIYSTVRREYPDSATDDAKVVYDDGEYEYIAVDADDAEYAEYADFQDGDEIDDGVFIPTTPFPAAGFPPPPPPYWVPPEVYPMPNMPRFVPPRYPNANAGMPRFGGGQTGNFNAVGGVAPVSKAGKNGNVYGDDRDSVPSGGVAVNFGLDFVGQSGGAGGVIPPNGTNNSAQSEVPDIGSGGGAGMQRRREDGGEISRKMRILGEKQEAEIRQTARRYFWLRLFKLFLSVVAVAALMAVLAYAVNMLVSGGVQAENGTVQHIAQEQANENFEKSLFRIPHGLTRDCLESFYRAVGFVDDNSVVTDILLKGELKMGGKTEPIYCIKKTVDNKMFVKVGRGVSARAYLVLDAVNGVKQLLDGGMSGGRRDLGDVEARIIRAIPTFDEPLFMRAFSRNYGKSEDLSVSYEGDVELGGVAYKAVGISLENGGRALFYFDPKTKLLSRVSYKFGSDVIDVLFSDYKPIGDGQQRPYVRRIFKNSKPFAEVDFDFIVKRDGLIFPN